MFEIENSLLKTHFNPEILRPPFKQYTYSPGSCMMGKNY